MNTTRPVGHAQSDLSAGSSALTDAIIDGSERCIVDAPGFEPAPAVSLLDQGQRAVSAVADRFETNVIATALSNTASSVAVVLGAIAAGVTVVSLPTRGPSQSASDYHDVVASAAASSGAGVILDVGASLVESRCRLPVVTYDDAVRHKPDVLLSLNDFQLIQHTSGSTGDPRGVVLEGARVHANVVATLSRLEVESGDSSCCWLPLSHDMGLIGLFLGAVTAASTRIAGRSSFTLIAPTTFLRSPSGWLRSLSERKTSFTAVPDFALRLLLRRLSRHETFDLSHLRAIIIGGETNRVGTVNELLDEAPFLRLSPTAIWPAYGFAEAGLAVAMKPGSEAFRTAAVPLEPDSHGSATIEVILSGTPLDGYEVRTDNDRRISVRGPSIGSHYTDGVRIADRNGWFHTGDRGAIVDGHVAVLSRLDDMIVVAGRNVPGNHVDEAIDRVRGVRAGRAAAVGLPDGRWAAVAEVHDPSQLDVSELLRDIRAAATEVSGVSPDLTVLVRKGQFPVTSSGKPRRSELGRRLAGGQLEIVAAHGDLAEWTR